MITPGLNLRRYEQSGKIIEITQNFIATATSERKKKEWEKLGVLQSGGFSF
jgi:hypothetical protein